MRRMAASLCAQPLVLLSLQFAAAVAMIAAVMGSNSLPVNMNEQREFDYFKLSLQWPGTVCRRTRHCCSSNACCRRYISTLLFFKILNFYCFLFILIFYGLQKNFFLQGFFLMTEEGCNCKCNLREFSK